MCVPRSLLGTELRVHPLTLSREAEVAGVEVVRAYELAELSAEGGRCRHGLFRRGLGVELDRADESLGVVRKRDALEQAGVDETALRARQGLIHETGEDVRGVRRGAITTDARSVPADQKGHVPHRGSERLACDRLERCDVERGERRERIRASLPAAELRFREREYLVDVHVAGDDQGGIVRHIVALMQVLELVERRAGDRDHVAAGVLPFPPGVGPELSVSDHAQERLGLGGPSLQLASHHATLDIETLIGEDGLPDEVRGEVDRLGDVLGGREEVVPDRLVAGDAVPARVDRRRASAESAFGASVGLPEQHVLEQVWHALEFVVDLSECAGAKDHLHGRERDRIAPHDDHLKPVLQHA